MTSRSKTLAGLGMRTLDEYVDSLPAHDKAIESRHIAIDSEWTTYKDGEKVQVTGIKVFDDGVDDVWFTKKGRIQILTRDEFLNLYQPAPAIDDTFNDDTPAQTFGVLENMRKIICLHCGLGYQLYHNRVSIERDGMCRKCFDKANASKMRLVGIAGLARAGKDTLASYLLDNLSSDWTRSSFADPIKKMLEVIGVDCSDEAKAVIDDRFCYTPRHMMQTLGTEWGRHMIDGDIWVKAFARLNAGRCVIVPDVRFENEAELVREHGVLIHLVGRGGIEGNHVSENAIEFKPGDIVIDNSRDLAWLHAQVDGNAVLSDFVAEVSE